MQNTTDTNQTIKNIIQNMVISNKSSYIQAGYTIYKVGEGIYYIFSAPEKLASNMFQYTALPLTKWIADKSGVPVIHNMISFVGEIIPFFINPTKYVILRGGGIAINKGLDFLLPQNQISNEVKGAIHIVSQEYILPELSAYVESNIPHLLDTAPPNEKIVVEEKVKIVESRRARFGMRRKDRTIEYSKPTQSNIQELLNNQGAKQGKRTLEKTTSIKEQGWGKHKTTITITTTTTTTTTTATATATIEKAPVPDDNTTKNTIKVGIFGIASQVKINYKPCLLDSTTADKDLVYSQYAFAPVEKNGIKYDVKEVKLIDNKDLSSRFETHKRLLHRRSRSPAFKPRPDWKGYTIDLKLHIPANNEIQPGCIYLYIDNGKIKFKAINWEGHIQEKVILEGSTHAIDKNSILSAFHSLSSPKLSEDQENIIFKNILRYNYMKKETWRETIYHYFNQLAEPHKDHRYPDVKQLYQWHGISSKEAFDGIMDTGYANLATTDSGFFGKGIYTTNNAKYAEIYAQSPRGFFILNKVAYLTGFPVLKTDDLLGKPNFGNYDAHLVLVAPRDPNNPGEVNFDPSLPNNLHTYTELVVFNPAACLPTYYVELQPCALHTTQVYIKNNPGEQAYYLAGRCRERQPLVAFYYYLQAKKNGNTQVDQEINELLNNPVCRNSFSIN